jgi:hydroxypyruvate reductase
VRPAPPALLRSLFDAAVAAAAPGKVLASHLPPPPKGPVLVLGAGKASAAMAAAVERAWPEVDLRGLVVTPYGHGADVRRIAVAEASHPHPDAAGEAAARRILELAQDARPDELVLCLISGGGSALMALPAPGLTLGDKQAVNRALLRSGAAIGEINTVRKHLSAVKGGRLALAAWPAPMLTLAISDVPGDDPALIASGPTVADPTTFADALAVMDRHGLTEPRAVIDHLRRATDETPKPGDERLMNTAFRLIATPMASLETAAEAARDHGVTPLILGDAIEGEARDVAAAMAAHALRIASGREGPRPPCVLISGGETSVTLRGRGRGGRNSEFLLALAIALGDAPGVHAIAGDTDGIDGSEDNAGAVIGDDTLARAAGLGLSPAAHLANNDAYGFFAAMGGLVITGPTRTNVNDFRAVFIEPR